MIENSQVIEKVKNNDQTQVTTDIFPENVKGIGAACALMGIMVTMLMHLQLNMAEASKDCYTVQTKAEDQTVVVMDKNIPKIEKIARMRSVDTFFTMASMLAIGIGITCGAGMSIGTLVSQSVGSIATITTGYADFIVGLKTKELGDNTTKIGKYQAYSTFFQKWVAVTSGRSNSITDVTSSLTRAVNTVISSYKNGAQRIFG